MWAAPLHFVVVSKKDRAFEVTADRFEDAQVSVLLIENLATQRCSPRNFVNPARAVLLSTIQER